MSEKCHSILMNRQGQMVAQVVGLSVQLDNGHVIPEHLHPEDQLLFASQGVMTVRTRQGIWVVPPLRAVWIPANTLHTVSMSGRVSMRTLYLLPSLARALPRKCFVINVSSLLRQLILHAMQLLASGEKVTGAALEAGYSSTSAFISMFRKQLGTTPTRFFES